MLIMMVCHLKDGRVGYNTIIKLWVVKKESWLTILWPYVDHHKQGAFGELANVVAMQSEI